MFIRLALRVAVGAVLLAPKILYGLVYVMGASLGAAAVITAEEYNPGALDRFVEESDEDSIISRLVQDYKREREETAARLLAEKRDWRLKKKTWRTDNTGWKRYMRWRIRNGALGDAFKDLKCACCGRDGFSVRYEAYNHALENHPQQMQRWMDKLDKEIRKNTFTLNEVQNVCLILESLSWEEIQLLKGDVIDQDVFYDATPGLDSDVKIRYGPIRDL